MEYNFLPIGFLSIFSVTIPGTVTVGQLSPECQQRLANLLDDLSNEERTLNAYYASPEKHYSYVAADHTIEVANHIRYTSQGKSDLLENYAKSLKSIREGSASTQEV